ncbi:PSD1 and planctomycete cytochrome C domain-containing protein [Blastopirellula sp. J2-11]|uniref:PSD1 and planctomycete cytochrome C domain-containing protein n=1 Tax=Blastopirellula sp. J2-11 TaxID=2943192 RepID=UPI0021C96FDF|nr:PSD1 and planctomycete cytochrome C domain-containing protein [Blastopirellula sp. J2-11]UUO04517.1 PSD1 and planctomycete cytochrome C domain-containing protein [Blastopirellula sp. J2-11]
MKRLNFLPVLTMLVLQFFVQPIHAEEVQFSRDVRPILSDKCFSCHGPDEESRQVGLRLDIEKDALSKCDSGATAIVPGSPMTSEIIARINSEDPSLRMPPDGHDALKQEEVDLLTRWIEQGAKWEGHWAFTSPARPTAPPVRQVDKVRNEIDSFILSRLEKEGLTFSPEADKAKLIRRVTLDLTGLPPTTADVSAFLADDRIDAYERVVDRLLESPRYGEHLARYWLDAVRYGDTHGLHLDNYREMWPYRDWVVSAFNTNMPYDQFLTEQLAGDLLPDATIEQKIASGFNRCNLTTGEGGSIEEEILVRNVVDRVTTTGTIFMGLTLECARCHDHKYDPITSKEFYSLFAFFNNLDGPSIDDGKKDSAPMLRVLTSEEKVQIDELNQEIATVTSEIAAQIETIDYQDPIAPSDVAPYEPTEIVWIEDAVPIGAKTGGGWNYVSAPEPVFGGDKAFYRSAEGLSQHYFIEASPPLEVTAGDVLFAHVYIDPENPPKQIMLEWYDGSWEHRAYWGEDHITWGKDKTPSRQYMGALPEAGTWVKLEIPIQQVALTPGAKVHGWSFTQFDGTIYWDSAGVITKKPQQTEYESLLIWQRDVLATDQPDLPQDILAIIQTDQTKRSIEEQGQLKRHFLKHVYTGTRKAFSHLFDRLAKAEKRIEEVRQNAPTTLIYRERDEHRPAYVLKRGEYANRGEMVERSTPKFLPPMTDELSLDRLGLAKWLTASQHPLTSRVFVNRLWQQLFGTGIVKTSEDFGSQGEMPSHPELLDWLAVQFIEDGWDIKRSLRRMVLSSAYRQSSRATKEAMQRDPNNRLLARGPRFRLDAEPIRDQALAISGLLVYKMGGASVKPPQPDGLWLAVGYGSSNTVRFSKDEGADKIYRRTLYTFIKRTAPPPQISTLDGPSRESCTVRRERTNTPLQALLLMNDPQYVEAARAFAERILHEGGDSVEDRLKFAFRLATARLPDDEDLRLLKEAYQSNQESFQEDVEAANKLIAVGETPPVSTSNPSELAAWTLIANTILNLDEVITKN